MRCEAEIEKKCVQQEEWHAEQQWRWHVSQNSAQSTALYNYSSYPSVQAHAPPPPLLQLAPSLFQPHLPLQSQVSPPAVLPPHPGIPLNALLQVSVVDFVQQRVVANSVDETGE